MDITKAADMPEGYWDETIRAGSWRWYELKRLVQYKDLLFALIKRDFIVTYRQTILGPVWHLIQPLATCLLFFLVFKEMPWWKGVSKTQQLVFYMANSFLWQFFYTSFNGIAQVFLQHAALFRKVYFPKILLPLAIIGSNFIKLSIHLAVFLVGLLLWQWYDAEYQVSWKMLLSIPWLLLLGAIALGIGLLLAAASLRYRDVSFVIGFALQLLLFITPVCYPAHFFDKYALLNLNPLTPIFSGFAAAFTTVETTASINWAYACSVGLVALVLGTIAFLSTEQKVADIA